MSLMRAIVKDWLPPAILRLRRHYRSGGIRFEGNYVTWEDASSQCTGYDAAHILEKVLDATLKVKRGEAAFERDSVLFDEIEYAWPVTAGLMWAAAQNGGRLDVLDFGGSLGSSYFQNRVFLAELPHVRWSVVEQVNYVEAGREHIQDDTLRFYSSIDDCHVENKPNVVLLSSVLQYLAEPKLTLIKLIDFSPDYLIVDRTPFLNIQGSSIINIQRVPPKVYLASYPIWFFDLNEFIELLKNLGYSKVCAFESLDKLSDSSTWRGFLFKREGDK
jgi:putative methyltransferase (TIGR04325 family)